MVTFECYFWLFQLQFYIEVYLSVSSNTNNEADIRELYISLDFHCSFVARFQCHAIGSNITFQV